ncbi:MAG: alpha/beta hydrolase [Actinoallomurus sp.]
MSGRIADPRRRRRRTAGDIVEGADVEPLTLHAMDGVRIDAGYTAGVGDLCVVLVHGFTGNWRQPNTRRIAARLSQVGAVIAIDLRGHGRSGGLSTVGDREVLDVDAAVRHARHLGYERVALVGFSLGGMISIRHAALIGGVEAVVSVSAPSRWYYRDTKPMRQAHWAIERPAGRLAVRLARHTRVASKRWEEEPEAPYRVADRISPVPFLVVHGDADPFLPAEHGRLLYDSAAEPRELWMESGFGHAEGAATPELIGRISGWVAARTRDREPGRAPT